MTKDQEARILGNQALIMRGLARMLDTHPNGGAAMAQQLKHRILDNETFIKDFLK